MDYSVVIRTKNCAASILNCLELVLAQSSKPFEIIVVDSGSTDKTVEIAKQLNCKIIYYPNNCAFNFSKALNIGIAEVRSKIVCCLSSHVMIHDANLIKYMIQNLEQLSLTGISSNCQNLMLRKKKQFEEAEKKITIIDKDYYDGFSLSNSFSIFRKKDWSNLPFDETIPRCEDQLWGNHYISKMNKKFGFVNNTNTLYLNKHFTNKKWLLEKLWIFRNYKPNAVSFYDFIKIVKTGLRNFRQQNFRLAYLYFLFPFYLILDRLKKIEIKSGRI